MQTVPNPEAITVETGVCAECRNVLGITPMGEPVRPPHPCIRCNSLKFIRLQPRDYDRLGIRPLVVTHTPQLEGGMVTHYSPYSFGSLEMYICHECGFTEWYCRNPKSFPIGQKFMTELVDYGNTNATSGPFR